MLLLLGWGPGRDLWDRAWDLIRDRGGNRRSDWSGVRGHDLAPTTTPDRRKALGLVKDPVGPLAFTPAVPGRPAPAAHQEATSATEVAGRSFQSLLDMRCRARGPGREGRDLVRDQGWDRGWGQRWGLRWGLGGDLSWGLIWGQVQDLSRDRGWGRGWDRGWDQRWDRGWALGWDRGRGVGWGHGCNRSVGVGVGWDVGWGWGRGWDWG